jgi:broad specificity phosphatase PhoE
MTDLWLLRHGQTDWNVTGRWQGQTSEAPGLNDMGRAQAISVREHLTGVRFTAIYCSDLLRARQTAKLISESLNLNISLEPRLREMNLGAWEGMLSDDIEARYPRELAERAHDPLHARPPHGEAPSDVKKRVIAAVMDIAKKYPDESVLIVSHGIALAVIICHAQGIPMEEVYKHIPENTTPCRVEWNLKG